MNERAPLPSSVTQPHSGEAPPVQTSEEAPKPDYSRQQRYAKTEKGKKTIARVQRNYHHTEKGKKVHREAKKRWRRKRRQEQLSQHLTTNP